MAYKHNVGPCFKLKTTAKLAASLVWSVWQWQRGPHTVHSLISLYMLHLWCWSTCLWIWMSDWSGGPPVVYQPRNSMSLKTCLTERKKKEILQKSTASPDLVYFLSSHQSSPKREVLTALHGMRRMKSKPRTLFLLGVVVLLVNMHSVVYGVRQQFKRVHHLYVSSLLLSDQSSNHWPGEKKHNHPVTDKLSLTWRKHGRHITAYTPSFFHSVVATHTLHWSPLLWADAYPVVGYVEDDQRV